MIKRTNHKKMYQPLSNQPSIDQYVASVHVSQHATKSIMLRLVYFQTDSFMQDQPFVISFRFFVERLAVFWGVDSYITHPGAISKPDGVAIDYRRYCGGGYWSREKGKGEKDEKEKMRKDNTQTLKQVLRQSRPARLQQIAGA